MGDTLGVLGLLEGVNRGQLWPRHMVWTRTPWKTVWENVLLHPAGLSIRNMVLRLRGASTFWPDEEMPAMMTDKIRTGECGWTSHSCEPSPVVPRLTAHLVSYMSWLLWSTGLASRCPKSHWLLTTLMVIDSYCLSLYGQDSFLSEWGVTLSLSKLLSTQYISSVSRTRMGTGRCQYLPATSPVCQWMP